MIRRARSVAAATALLGLLSACPKDDREGPTPKPEPSASAQASASATAASTAQVAPSGPPTFELRPWKGAGDGTYALHAIEGALMVSDETRVGRIADGAVEWIGEIPKTSAFGSNSIYSVHGHWPDWVDALYQSSNGRAPTPTLFPVRGVSLRHVFSDGGGAGWLTGLATIGASTLAAGYSQGQDELVTVRGPTLERKQLTREEAGCTDAETFGWPGPAVSPFAFAATGGGTLMSIGHLCRSRAPVAEIWDKGPTSRIVELSRWLKKIDYDSELYPGNHDDMFLVAGKKGPVLHYAKGELTTLPSLTPLELVFTSPEGVLHASDGHTLHRFDGKRWTPLGHFEWPSHLTTIALHEGALWASGWGTIFQLKESRAIVDDGCKTPFVYLYDVSPKNGDDFAFPATTKALSSFEGAEELSLVEVKVEGARRLGVVVADRAQGKRLIEHVKREMKDEHPQLKCYAPVSPRRIRIPVEATTAAKKPAPG